MESIKSSVKLSFLSINLNHTLPFVYPKVNLLSTILVKVISEISSMVKDELLSFKYDSLNESYKRVLSLISIFWFAAKLDANKTKQNKKYFSIFNLNRNILCLF